MNPLSGRPRSPTQSATSSGTSPASSNTRANQGTPRTGEADGSDVPTRNEHVEFPGERRPSTALQSLDLAPSYSAKLTRDVARQGLTAPQPSSVARALDLATSLPDKPALNLHALHPVLDNLGGKSQQAITRAMGRQASALDHAASAARQRHERALRFINNQDLAGLDRLLQTSALAGAGPGKTAVGSSASSRPEHLEFADQPKPPLGLRALDLSATVAAYLAREDALAGQRLSGPAAPAALDLATAPGRSQAERLHPVLDTMGPKTLSGLKNLVRKHNAVVQQQAAREQAKLASAIECVQSGDMAGFERIMGISFQQFVDALKPPLATS